MITDPMHQKQSFGMDIGHFFLALNPTLFREEGAFEHDVTALCDALRGTVAVDPAQPVMVAGDRERRTASVRMREGIPVGPGLLAKVREVAEKSGVAWVLEG